MVELFKSHVPEFHKLRAVTQRKDGSKVLGISLPYDKVRRLEGTYYSTEIIGTTIILSSGCKP